MRTSFIPLLALCCVSTARSQEIASNTVHAIRVTAERPQRLEIESPSDTTFISGDDIERSQATSVPDLLAREANILFRSSTGKTSDGQVSMRGFGDNSGLRVLVEVDGHKLNRPDMGTIDWSQLPIADVAHIEVIRGGNNVLYGNHALAGVIKITTKKGGEPHLYLRTVGGTDSFEQYSALATGGSGCWYADGGVDYLREPGFRTNSLSWSKNTHASIGRYIGDEGNLTFRASVGENYTEFPGPLTLDQLYDDPTQSSNLGDQYTQSTNGLFTIQWEGDHDWGKSKLGAGYNFRDTQWELSGIYARNKHQGFSLSPRVQIGPDEDHLILGWDFFYDRLQHDQLSSATNADLTAWAELDRLTTGPYVFAQKELTETFTISGGARYEYARTDNRYVDYDFEANSEPFIDTPWGFPAPNPDYDADDTTRVISDEDSYEGTVTKDGWAGEASLLWQPIEPLSLWIGWDHVYRYPVLDETASYQGYPLSDPLNENLDPEQGDSFEIGIKFNDEQFLISLTGFYLKLEDEIVFDSDTNLNVNIGTTERYGIEAEAGYTMAFAGISARGSMVDAQFVDGEWEGKKVPLVPWANAIFTGWIEPIKPIRCTIYYSYVGSQYQGNDYANENDKMDDYGLLGARIDIIPTESVRIFIKADNILDKTYAAYGYSGSYYPGAGQSLQAGVSIKF